MPHLFILSVSIQHTKTPVDCVHHVNGTSIIAFVLIRLLCVSILSLCFLIRSIRLLMELPTRSIGLCALVLEGHTHCVADDVCFLVTFNRISLLHPKCVLE